MVGQMEIMLILLGIVGVLAVIAERIQFPFPIMMVLGGIVIALVPRLPEVSLDPDLVLIIFLPPIIYSAAFFFPWPDFRMNLRPILWLAVGLVFATMTCVALISHWLIPGITLAAGFVLGAIVSPPDAAAATSVLHKLRIPPRLANVLEGESLVNDASGLVSYSLAIIAVTTGTFSLLDAAGDFIWDSTGGVGIGLFVGWIVTKIQRTIHDTPTGITLQILTPYAAYLPAEHLGVSGVLAAVAAGLYVGHRSTLILDSRTRLQGETIWGFINYFINGVLFILIGLQFPDIIHSLKQFPWWELAGYGLLVSLVVIFVRFAWIYGMGWTANRFGKQNQDTLLPISNGILLVTSWAGMRGAVSLAAALAIPTLMDNGEPFPGRELIIFLTYCVIFSTLVLQGFTLPWMVRRAGISSPDGDGMREAQARIILLTESLELIDDLIAKDPDSSNIKSHLMLRELYQTRLDHMNLLFGEDTKEPQNMAGNAEFIFRMFAFERRRVIELRDQGFIDESIRRRITHDIDTEEMRMLRTVGAR